MGAAQSLVRVAPLGLMAWFGLGFLYTGRRFAAKLKTHHSLYLPNIKNPNMANTYSQIYIHLVFAVKGRISVISPKWKEDLYKFMSGIISNRSQKLLAINGMPDHVHLLVGIKPTCSLSDLVRDVKAGSSKHINDNKWVKGRFEWQEGFGAFSLGHSQLDTVFSYIRNQEEHHRKKTFLEEYQEFLRLYQVDYQAEYIFKEIVD